MTNEPRVSIILCVRNGLPHVRDAVESVRALSYSNYELVIQDGASTDGTLEYVQSLDGFPSLTVASAPDTGIGQGFNRAVQRCRGEVIGSVDADNLLRPDALNRVVQRFREHPDAAVIYGACEMVDADRRVLHPWTPPEFDLLGLLDGSVVPPFATSFFSRARCGDELRFDEAFRTVADFDLWIRLSHLEIVRVRDVFGQVRVGGQSSTWNPANYDQQSGFKVRAMRQLLAGPHREIVLQKLGDRAEAGLYLWAVDSLAVIGGGQELIDRYFENASRSDVMSERFRDILARARPHLPASDPSLGERLLECAIRYLERSRPDTALVYLDYLQAAGFDHPALKACVDRAKTDQWNTHTATDVATYLQSEINKRDQINAEKSAWWSAEVVKRDATIDELRREIDWMRSGWRRFVVRRPPAPGTRD